MSTDPEKTELNPNNSKKDSSKASNVEQASENGGQKDTFCRRFWKWVSKEVFDWNPEYVKTVRGILHLGHIVSIDILYFQKEL